ncbi:unnamed protein product [Owenia fusiformis]|uniref:Uncharacterized protein n=1 Tax=Owenia fusiformis TaxID=6347 RepID=A0A8J1U6D9_OWEFU|nr:unnamed protein product [Owenia fusiformis]
MASNSYQELDAVVCRTPTANRNSSLLNSDLDSPFSIRRLLGLPEESSPEGEPAYQPQTDQVSPMKLPCDLPQDNSCALPLRSYYEAPQVNSSQTTQQRQGTYNNPSRVHYQGLPKVDYRQPRGVMNQLSHDPAFYELSAALAGDMTTTNTPSLLFHSIAPQMTVPPTLRASMLDLRFGMLDIQHCVSSNQLLSFYRQHTATIEHERYQALTTSGDVYYQQSVQLHYDKQRHLLIDRVEESLKLLENSSSCQTTSTKMAVNEPRNSDGLYGYTQTLQTQPSAASKPTTGKIQKSGRVYRRLNFSKDTTCVLMDWYLKNTHNPYLSSTECRALAVKAKVSPAQVRKWLANKRNRDCKSQRLDIPVSQRSHTSHPIRHLDTSRESVNLD